MKIRQAGFTLIELLIVVSLIGVLASLAVPGFRTMLVKRTVQSAADALMTDMRYARSEAVKQSSPVSVCQSTDGASCAGVTGGWANGWIVFFDNDSDGVVDTGETILRVQQQLSSMGSIASTPAGSPAFLTYQATGWARGAGRTFIFTPSGTVPPGTVRIACVSAQGRAGLRSPGATSC